MTLGIDLGGSSIKWALLRSDEVVDRGAVPTPDTGTADVTTAIARIIDERGRPAQVGLGIPGLHDGAGATTLLPNVPGDWSGHPLADRVADQTGRRPHLLNDARAFTLAELRLGAGVGVRDLLAVTLGTGVGGGVALDRRLHLRDRGRSGEIGHQVVDPDGPPCGCGARGCVETFASAPAILAGGIRAVLQGLPTTLRAACGGQVELLRAEDVVAAAADGDTQARDVVDRAGTALGAGLAGLCTVLRPERIVVGGGAAAALPQLRPSLEGTLAARAPMLDPLPEVVAGDLGSHAGAIGAALWAREHDQDPTRGAPT